LDQWVPKGSKVSRVLRALTVRSELLAPLAHKGSRVFLAIPVPLAHRDPSVPQGPKV
jgi:hypothetical protein